MLNDPCLPPTPPEVDHPAQSKLAQQVEAMNAAALLRHIVLDPLPGKHMRAGITKNKMQPRNKARAKMARESKRRNKVR